MSIHYLAKNLNRTMPVVRVLWFQPAILMGGLLLNCGVLAHPLSHGLIYPCLPTFATGLQGCEHVSVKTDRGGHLERLVFGATLAQGAELRVDLGRKELVGGQGAGKVSVCPLIRPLRRG